MEIGNEYLWVVSLFSGAVGGAVVITIKDFIFERRQKSREQKYLAARVVCLLDEFVNGCGNVAADNGYTHGAMAGGDQAAITADIPDVNFSDLEVNWSSLPTNLMYRILCLPNLIKEKNEYISSVAEYSSCPPDHEEFFDARQLSYIELGIKANAFATELRLLSGLPARGISSWDVIKFMKQEECKINQRRIAMMEERNRVFNVFNKTKEK